MHFLLGNVAMKAVDGGVVSTVIDTLWSPLNFLLMTSFPTVIAKWSRTNAPDSEDTPENLSVLSFPGISLISLSPSFKQVPALNFPFGSSFVTKTISILSTQRSHETLFSITHSYSTFSPTITSFFRALSSSSNGLKWTSEESIFFSSKIRSDKEVVEMSVLFL